MTNTKIDTKVDFKKKNPLGPQMKISNPLKMGKESSWSQTSPLKHSVLEDSEMPTEFSKKENKTPILYNQPSCFFKSPNIETTTKCSGNGTLKKKNRPLNDKWKNYNKRTCSEHWIYMTVGTDENKVIKYGYRAECKYFKPHQM